MHFVGAYFIDMVVLVGEEGLEPSRHCCQQILSLSCIPISPLARVIVIF